MRESRNHTTKRAQSMFVSLDLSSLKHQRELKSVILKTALTLSCQSLVCIVPQ